MSLPEERHQILISADGHAGADLWGYKPYLERRSHDEFDAWARTFYDPWAEETDQKRPANHRLGVASARASLNWDAAMRLRYLDRGIGHMILSGVFERHPKLMFVTTEITSASEVPAYLAKLDILVRLNLGAGTLLHEHVRDAVAELRRAPSEYFTSNCFIAGPTHDLRQAYDLGTPNLMWGADVPHSEGTSPYTLEVVRTTLWDLQESELETILATRAADVYNFDLPQLQALANRIGPVMREIKTPLPPGQRPRYPDQTRCTVFMDQAALRQTADRP